jgi:CheY-like chemotaxis protein
MNILLVEDDVVDAQTVRRYFASNRLPHALKVIDNAQQALEHLRRQSAGGTDRLGGTGLVILDLNMPGMNGLEFLAEIKADPELHTIPVIVLSTSDLESDVRASFEGGVAGYFVKPLEYGEFVSTLHSILRYWELCQHPQPQPAKAT